MKLEKGKEYRIEKYGKTYYCTYRYYDDLFDAHMFISTNGTGMIGLTETEVSDQDVKIRLINTYVAENIKENYII